MADRIVTPIPKSKKRKKTKKQSITAVLDATCGELVRSRGHCEECGTSSDLQWAHGFSRRYRNTRWDTRNGFALCRGCHFRFTHRPLEWDDWLRAKWGDDLYDEIRALALSTEKVDHAAVLASLRAAA